jgi:sucrose synthase
VQTLHTEVAIKLQEMGFERGWGDTVGRIRETMHLLAEILQAPDPDSLQACPVFHAPT